MSTTDELLAAATLRAQLFYSYPKLSARVSEGLEGIKARLKHDFAVQDLLKSRLKSEFERVRSAAIPISFPRHISVECLSCSQQIDLSKILDHHVCADGSMPYEMIILLEFLGRQIV